MNKKNSLIIMTAMIINSMIGSGVFGLPQSVSANSYGYAVILGWIVAGVGTLSLAILFSRLAVEREDLDAGPYAFALAQYGNMGGFIMGWGYWTATLLSNITLMVLAFAGLGKFFPVFGEGNTIVSLICESGIIWTIYYLVANRASQAQMVNVIVTIMKVVPILVFIFLILINFDSDIFAANLDAPSTADAPATSVFEQVRSTMLAVMWAFVGIEGASVVSKSAENRSDIGKATLRAFIITFTIYACVSILSVGIVPHATLAKLTNPSTVGVLEYLGKSWSGSFINIGMIISVLGAFFVWTQYAMAVPAAVAKDGIFPPQLKSMHDRDENDNRTNWQSAEFISTLAVQGFLALAYFTESTYNMLYEISTSGYLLAYLVSAIFYMNHTKQRSEFKMQVVAFIAVAYSLWLTYAAGMEYVLLIFILYTMGLPVYILYTKNPLTAMEKKVVLAITSLSGVAVYYLATQG